MLLCVEGTHSVWHQPGSGRRWACRCRLSEWHILLQRGAIGTTWRPPCSAAASSWSAHSSLCHPAETHRGRLNECVGPQGPNHLEYCRLIFPGGERIVLQRQMVGQEVCAIWEPEWGQIPENFITLQLGFISSHNVSHLISETLSNVYSGVYQTLYRQSM